MEKVNVLYIGGHTPVLLGLQKYVEAFDVKHCLSPYTAAYLLDNHKFSPDILFINRKVEGFELIPFLEKCIQSKNIFDTVVVTEPSFKFPNKIQLKLQELQVKSIIPYNEPADNVYFRVEVLRKLKQQSIKEVQNYTFTLPVWKRCLDLLIASFALVFLSPIMLLTALLIKLESKGPAIYTSKRVGANYKIIDFFKFRSMYQDAENQKDRLVNQNMYKKDESVKVENTCSHSRVRKLYSDKGEVCELCFLESKENESPYFKLQNDPRVTVVGKWIRNWSVDELPQIFNVLKGDLSIVGNRPLPLYEAELLTNDESSARFMAPAGITGLWQVRKRGKHKMSVEERKELDCDYARSFNLWSDLKIILMTVPAVFQKESV